VFLVVEENHSFQQTIGNSAMPYLNSLASKYGLATQYFANMHPSLPNYFELTTGQTVTSGNGVAQPVTADNVVQALMGAGKTWECYAESLPNVGYRGPDAGPYDHSHVPFGFFATMQNDPRQAGNIVPFSQLAADLAADQLPNYGFIVPNIQSDGHDCPGGAASGDDNAKLANADAWLAANVQPLLENPTFQASGLLLVTFDESMDGDTAHGGGQVPLLVISSKSKPGFKSTTLYQHQSTLRLMLDALGITHRPGDSAHATQMGEFFQQ
jgi:acid phosphatase